MRHGVQRTHADVSIALHARAARVHGSVHWFGVVLTRSGSSVGVDGSEDTTGNVRVYAAVRLCGCSIVRAGVRSGVRVAENRPCISSMATS